MKLDVLNLNGKKVGDIELNDSVFQCEVNEQAIFDALLRQQSSWRQRADPKYPAAARSRSVRRVQVEQDKVASVPHSTDTVVSHSDLRREATPSSSTARSEDWLYVPV